MRSPLAHPLIVTQRFGARPAVYPNTKGHPGIDFRSPMGDDWFAVVPGVLHTIDYKNFWGKWNAYGAAVGLDWGQADGTFIRFLYGHGQNRKQTMNHKHVVEGAYVAESGNTGFSTAPHLHFEMRQSSRSGRYYDSKDNYWYNLLDPEIHFLRKYKIPYTIL